MNFKSSSLQIKLVKLVSDAIDMDAQALARFVQKQFPKLFKKCEPYYDVAVEEARFRYQQHTGRKAADVPSIWQCNKVDVVLRRCGIL